MYRKLSGILAAGGLAALSGGFAQAQEFGAKLNGFEELGALNAETGAIRSNGQGTLDLDVDKNQATYTLTYSGLSAPVTQAHIHFGKIHVPGGVMVFFCTNLGNGPPGTSCRLGRLAGSTAGHLGRTPRPDTSVRHIVFTHS